MATKLTDSLKNDLKQAVEKFGLNIEFSETDAWFIRRARYNLDRLVNLGYATRRFHWPKGLPYELARNYYTLIKPPTP